MKNVKPYIEKAVELFATTEYNPSRAVDNVTAMCDRVREELKRFNYKRYRYIVSGTRFDIQCIRPNCYAPN